MELSYNENLEKYKGEGLKLSIPIPQIYNSVKYSKL